MTVEGASADLLAELLRDFESEVRKQNPEIERLLRPPASREAIQEAFGSIGLNAPEEALVLFGWHNGCEAEMALPARFLLPLDGMTQLFNLSRLGLGEWDWNPNWAQVMGSKYGLAIFCSDDPHQPPLVRSVEDSAGTADWQTDYQVVSLCTPVTWWIDALRHGWYRYDQVTHSWNSDITSIPQQIRMYRMS